MDIAGHLPGAKAPAASECDSLRAQSSSGGILTQQRPPGATSPNRLRDRTARIRSVSEWRVIQTGPRNCQTKVVSEVLCENLDHSRAPPDQALPGPSAFSHNSEMASDLKDLIPWQILNADLRIHRDHVVRAWVDLIDSGPGERACLKFLKEHAGLFFCDSARRLVTISELELGADYQPDFVVANDLSSYGFSYEFVELQDPKEPPLKQNGQYSDGVNEALSQITKWRRWLDGNKDTAKRILPSREFRRTGRFKPKYTIIAGRRTNEDRLLADRNYQSDNFQDISIRSFDHLTDVLRERMFAPLPILASAEMDRVELSLRNRLVNPFRTAIQSAQWRKAVEVLEDDHMAAKNAATLIALTSANNRLEPFLRAWEDLPEAKRQFYLSQINFMAASFGG